MQILQRPDIQGLKGVSSAIAVAGSRSRSMDRDGAATRQGRYYHSLCTTLLWLSGVLKASCRILFHGRALGRATTYINGWSCSSPDSEGAIFVVAFPCLIPVRSTT